MEKNYNSNNQPSCWEYRQCPDKLRIKCEAYLMDMGKECWFLRDLEDGGANSKIGDGCLKCDYYKTYNLKKNFVRYSE